MGSAMEDVTRLETIAADVEKIARRMREALRRDFCAKLASMSSDKRQRLHERLLVSASPTTPRRVIDALCLGSVSYGNLCEDAELAKFVDEGAAVEPMFELTGGMRRSYLSLQTAWEQLKDWCDYDNGDGGNCSTAWELLARLGALGQPIEVKRHAAMDASPFVIEVTRVCASPADSASFVTALRANASVVPPEGGAAVEDLLVLIDPDAPRASRLAVCSMLLKDAYASVVLCRELHLNHGVAAQLALHAHALFNVLQPPPRGLRKEDLEAHMRRQYLGRAYQCATCGFGPIDHFACGDLAAHNGQRVGSGVINNACPRCGWFSKLLSAWPKWDGNVPEEALMSCAQSEVEPVHITAASVEIALRICYSARVIWKQGQEDEPRNLCKKLTDWETLTVADGVEHPVQLLLALAVVQDAPDGIFGPVPIAQLLNEVCARRADDELRRVGVNVARRRVGAFLGVSFFSAPKPTKCCSLERQREAVVESCSDDYVIDNDAFDFKIWLQGALTPWANGVMFARRLRCVLDRRGGGWCQLARNMEAGPEAYADVVAELRRPAGSRDTLAGLLGVRCKEEATRILATVAAQAFLHAAPQSRRTRDVGGLLDEPLGDIRDECTLRGLCVELRMSYYDEIVAVKKRAWEEARKNWDGAGHVHALSKENFWSLWEGSYGEEAHRFLTSANQGFVNRYGPQ